MIGGTFNIDRLIIIELIFGENTVINKSLYSTVLLYDSFPVRGCELVLPQDDCQVCSLSLLSLINYHMEKVNKYKGRKNN